MAALSCLLYAKWVIDKWKVDDRCSSVFISFKIDQMTLVVPKITLRRSDWLGNHWNLSGFPKNWANPSFTQQSLSIQRFTFSARTAKTSSQIFGLLNRLPVAGTDPGGLGCPGTATPSGGTLTSFSFSLFLPPAAAVCPGPCSGFLPSFLYIILCFRT